MYPLSRCVRDLSTRFLQRVFSWKGYFSKKNGPQHFRLLEIQTWFGTKNSMCPFKRPFHTSSYVLWTLVYLKLILPNLFLLYIFFMAFPRKWLASGVIYKCSNKRPDWNLLFDGTMTGYPPKFSIAPEKWWLEEILSYWEGNFSGAMLNFGRVIERSQDFIYEGDNFWQIKRALLVLAL